MIIRNLDENHDWTFGKGRNNYASGNKCVGLNIQTRILSWLNDCFFAQSEGVDWVNRLGMKGQTDMLEQDIRTIIVQTPDVVQLVDFQFQVVGRVFTAQYTVNTRFSRQVSGVVEREF